MALPKDYGAQTCSLARSLEILGERWTLLIVRDAFYGVRRFSDFADHLGIPRSVLAARLDGLVAEQLLAKAARGDRSYAEYELTDKGRQLWPVIYGLIRWGDEHYAADGPPRLFEHAEDGGRITPDGTCPACGQHVLPTDLQAVPGPGLNPPPGNPDPVTAALSQPHRLLDDIRGRQQASLAEPEIPPPAPAAATTRR
jgi:DNA-binding HxlR family transcriptional regulator